MTESLFFTMLIVGIMGAGHCVAMCGGVAGALTFSLRPEVQLSFWRMLPYQIGYNLGRISSYVMAGMLFGFLGSGLLQLTDVFPVQQVLRAIAGAFMVMLGLYLAGWWNGIIVVEKAGQGIWKRLQPLAKKATPVRNLPQAWLYGLIWGWLPCGLVYSGLIGALTAGSALDGGLVMLGFGLGTLPALLLMGSFAFFFTKLSRNPWVRKVAGISVILMGVWQWQYLISMQQVLG